ncbi:class I SAM-dependent methyltransferase [Aestuariicoccus sp. MJ-SS9]|uniref:class I SAM-dependent methyltransferase n=1 Tax=Aestuariicoccus sp. MJ-SS9 TaxID=3079855 RepID=UPI0029062B9C|nr:class I SAM-dependent methyltransferase [Aestuariicoccus sp. MJ-SS9]MDU8911048.1 class I SAM-dependent methyltransferase [Aestuariicoccus sp. MJ-SS9]
MDMEAFLTLHKDLPREGPGAPEDVAWACALAGLAADAVICDAGSGPGGDVPALLAAAPSGRVVAVDAYFGAAADARFAEDPRVRGDTADMAHLDRLPEAPFDLIWCAGALYFLGLENGLAAMARALKPGGVLAFSEPARFVDAPDPAAEAIFEGYPLRRPEEIAAVTVGAGYEVLGQRKVPDAGWEAYFGPIEARVAELRPGADENLTVVLDEALAEAAAWRVHRDAIGYVLTVARRGA